MKQVAMAIENATANLIARKIDGEVIPPSPDQIALTLAAALVSAGCEAGAACMKAWWAVPEFYEGRRTYVETIARTVYETPGAPDISGSAA